MRANKGVHAGGVRLGGMRFLEEIQGLAKTSLQQQRRPPADQQAPASVSCLHGRGHTLTLILSIKAGFFSQGSFFVLGLHSAPWLPVLRSTKALVPEALPTPLELQRDLRVACPLGH